MKIRRLNIPLWCGYLACMAMITATVLIFVYYPQLRSEAEDVRRHHLDGGTIHQVQFESAWFVLNVFGDVARYGVPAIGLASVLFASWGAFVAKRLAARWRESSGHFGASCDIKSVYYPGIGVCV